MFPKVIFLVSTLSIYTSNGAVLLWSNNKLNISPLDVFTDENLEELVKELEYPEVAVYKSTRTLLPEFEGLLDGYYMAYNPNGDINTENATEISGYDDLALLDTKRVDANVLSVLVLPNERRRRDVVSESSTTEASAAPLKGPILYSPSSPKNIYSLLYASQPLVLRTANSTIELGKAVLVTIDKPNKNASLRLDVTVPNGEEKYILQFSFTWQNTYWSLITVKVKTTMISSSIDLTISEPFSVPARFSYHCNGVTVFSDAAKTTELLIYDLQVQPDSKDGTFGDVYDCVDFTTIPILSGLFVSGLLGVGLILALVAISEIKTMDKFDNQKTKQLVLTVTE